MCSAEEMDTALTQALSGKGGLVVHLAGELCRQLRGQATRVAQAQQQHMAGAGLFAEGEEKLVVTVEPNARNLDVKCGDTGEHFKTPRPSH